MKKKMKFWLTIGGLVILWLVFLLLGEPKLPGIKDFFDRRLFGIISIMLFLLIVILLFIVYFSSKFLDIHLLEEKEAPKEAPKETNNE